MIYQTAAVLFLSMNLAGSDDTPIEPITSDVIALTIATSDRAQTICDSYPDIVAGFASVVDDYDLAQEMVDDWAFVLVENGYDPSGNSRLTSEARDVIADWLHNCPAPFQLGGIQ